MHSPTPHRFEAIERLSETSASALPVALQIAKPTVYFKSALLRLLTGSVDLQCNLTGKAIKQRKNYSKLGAPLNRRVSKTLLADSVPCSLPEYSKHIISSAPNNAKFYSEIFHEFSGFFFLTRCENSIGAFVHLYRVLERMAYCLPLLWAAHAKDYEKTFNDLKTYFQNPKISELGVLKRFIPAFVDPIYLATPATFNIYSAKPDWQERYYQMILAAINDKTSTISEVPFSQITVNYGALTQMTIQIRNKYFHALTGAAESFDSTEMVDPNEFFAIINEEIANWFAFLIFRIFEYELS